MLEFQFNMNWERALENAFSPFGRYFNRKITPRFVSPYLYASAMKFSDEYFERLSQDGEYGHFEFYLLNLLAVFWLLILFYFL